MIGDSGRIFALEAQVRELMDRVAQLESQPIITDRPVQQTFWNCEKCYQLHIDMKVGDCACECHKVMCNT
jgi:hypothetical protein